MQQRSRVPRAATNATGGLPPSTLFRTPCQTRPPQPPPPAMEGSFGLLALDSSQRVVPAAPSHHILRCQGAVAVAGQLPGWQTTRPYDTSSNDEGLAQLGSRFCHYFWFRHVRGWVSGRLVATVSVFGAGVTAAWLGHAIGVPLIASSISMNSHEAYGDLGWRDQGDDGASDDDYFGEGADSLYSEDGDSLYWIDDYGVLLGALPKSLPRVREPCWGDSADMWTGSVRWCVGLQRTSLREICERRVFSSFFLPCFVEGLVEVARETSSNFQGARHVPRWPQFPKLTCHLRASLPRCVGSIPASLRLE